MSEEIPIWVNGVIQWVSGVDRKTTCKDVIEAVLHGDGYDRHNVKEYIIMERWRKVERPLDENSKILKIWSHWGDEKKEVRLCLKRINNDIDSGRGSPIGMGSTPSLKRRRHHRSRANGKPPWSNHEAMHPKRLAELGRLDKNEYEEYQTRKVRPFDPYDDKSGAGNDDGDDDDDNLIYDSRHCTYGEKIYGRRGDRKSGHHKSYQCTGTGVLHSTPVAEDPDKPTTSKCCARKGSKSRTRTSENIEKLMKLILAQGATIQSQLQKLKEREEQIESLEHERHRERVEKNGRNYLLETYLGSLDEAEIPEEERGNDSGVHTEGAGSDRTDWRPRNGKAVESKTLPSRSKRSRSESRTPDVKCEEKSTLKRTLSDNALAEGSGSTEAGVTVGDTPEAATEEEGNDLLELRRIQSQVEMWEKVFRINKKLEKEEENLVRLHIKIKRFQAENIKVAKEEESAYAKTDEEKDLERDRHAVERDLETLREDLDHNSKEIYQNFTRLREEDQLVEKKRTLLNRLITDLEETESANAILSEMVHVVPDPDTDSQEGRTSFSEPEVVPIRLYNNQRQDSSDAKPKIVKISFDDQVRSGSDRSTQEKMREPGAIKGILKNANRCDWKAESQPLYAGDDRYHVLPDTDVYYHHHHHLQPSSKHPYSKRPTNGTVMTGKTSIHNDTDSSTSSDTSGLCSMYSSSPTAEEPYVEPTYVLDTLV